MNKTKLLKSVVLSLFVALIILLPGKNVSAKVLDEIVDYTMTVDVADDTSVFITYDIQWKVLDSKSEGPLSWVRIGIPSGDNVYVLGKSDTISNISRDNSGGSFVRVDFDRDYYKDEIVHFVFEIEQNGMYDYNPDNDYAVYSFTPGWFDNIEVDNLTIKWNADNTIGISPATTVENGYYVWNSSLDAGDKYTVTVKYPSDAYPFVEYKSSSNEYDYEFSEHSFGENVVEAITIIVGMVFIFIFILAPFAVPAIIIYTVYKKLSGFTSGKETKITRTVIEYYPSCPNCGGSRAEGKDTCEYCGSNMIKSKETIDENEISKLDESVRDYKTNGTYRFANNPNKYVRVNVVTVPHVVSRPTSSSFSSTSRSSSGRSHSCAHSSCACACACACAGGGRAGCSTKDFYNTDLKLRNLIKNNRRK